MRNVTLGIVLCIQLFLTGCAGFGVFATSDPLTKLNDAEYLFQNYNRPLIAERLIFEAINIYQKQNDLRGLGNAHREYGDLLVSASVKNWENYYRRDGFRDKSVTFETREAKAKEYYAKALGYYQTAEKQLRESGPFDELTNLYYNMARMYRILGDREKSCECYDKCLAAYKENIRQNPKEKTIEPPGYKSLADFIVAQKKQIGAAQSISP